MPMSVEQQAQISEVAKSLLKEMGLDKIDRRFTPGGGDGNLDGGKWKSFGEMLSMIKKNREDPRLKALSEGTDSAGGFLVPAEFRPQLLQRSLERSVIRPYATTIPIARDKVTIPKVVETSHTSHLFGGIVAYWTEEAATKAQTDPVFGQVNLIPKKLTGVTRASDELLEDSAIALESLLVQQFGAAIAWYEDLAFLRGSGVGEPLGIFQSGALITPVRAVANQVALANLANIMARMYPDSLYGPNTIWIISPAVLAQLIQMVATVITWLPASGGAAGRIPAQILGMPFVVTEKVPTLGTTGDIGLYDLSYYLIGDRKDLRIDMDKSIYFLSDQTAWRFVERVDGQPWVDAAFTPYNGGNTLSPFVHLSSATS